MGWDAETDAEYHVNEQSYRACATIVRQRRLFSQFDSWAIHLQRLLVIISWQRYTFVHTWSASIHIPTSFHWHDMIFWLHYDHPFSRKKCPVLATNTTLSGLSGQFPRCNAYCRLLYHVVCCSHKQRNVKDFGVQFEVWSQTGTIYRSQLCRQQHNQKCSTPRKPSQLRTAIASDPHARHTWTWSIRKVAYDNLEVDLKIWD